MKLLIGLSIAVATFCSASSAVSEEYPPNGTVKIEKPKNLKDTDRVLVPHFAISFVVADKKSVTASTQRSNRFARSATSTTEAELVGLSYENMQAITDAAYENFIASLAANGIEAIEPDAASAQALARQTEMSMTKFLDAPAQNYSPYRKSFNQNIQDLTFVPTGTQLIAPRIGNTHIPHMYGASARDLDVPVLVVDLVLTFGHIAAEAREYYGIAGVGDASAQTSFAPGLQVMWSSDIKVYHSERKTGRLMIEKNAWTAAPFAAFESDPSEGYQSSRNKITVTVDNDRYREAALDVLSRATGNLITHMAAQ